MDSEDIVGMIIMLISCWGCAALFYGIGRWAQRRKDPMHFWSGSTIDPATITDIPAYNQENGKMWKRYSIPYWISGFFALFFGVSEWFVHISLAILVLAFAPGLYFLIRKYNAICREYMINT